MPCCVRVKTAAPMKEANPAARDPRRGDRTEKRESSQGRTGVPWELRVRRGSRRKGDDFDGYRHCATNLEWIIALLKFLI
jgi:hypothetical protein